MKPWEANESLREYTSRSVEGWLLGKAFAKDQPFFLIGIGWGSLLAIEVGFLLESSGNQARGILLIAGLRDRTSISGKLALSWKWVRWMPDPFVRKWAFKNWFGITNEYPRLNAETQEICQQMIRSLSISQFRWSVDALLGWERSRTQIDQLPIPVHQFHGRRDRSFPLPSPQDATLLLEGGHLIHLNHTGEIQRWIDAIARDDSLRARFEK